MTTLTGVEASPLTTDEATEALLSRWTDAEKPSDTDEGATDDEGDEITPNDTSDNDESDEPSDDQEGQDEPDQSDEDDASDEGEEDESEPVEAGDEALVKITVDGETKTVPVKELKRLFGQEASLTRKSQEVAEARKKAEADGARYMVAADRMLEKAQERFAPYAKIDWMVAQTRLDPEEFAALRAEATAAYQDVEFLKAESQQVLQAIETDRQKDRAEQAKKCVEVLTQDIPGWSKDTYDAIRSYAVNEGLDADEVSQVVDPVVIKLLNKARLYDQLKANAAPKKKKVASSPKKVIKQSNKAPTIIGKPKADTSALNNLRKSGSKEDAVEAFMSRWASDSDD